MQVLDSLIDGPLRLRNRREGDELIGMIVRYLRTGEEPEPRTDTQEAVLTAIRPVMETSRSRIVAGGNGGKSSSNDVSKAESKRPSKPLSKSGSKTASKSSSNDASKAESKRPSEEEEEVGRGIKEEERGSKARFRAPSPEEVDEYARSYAEGKGLDLASTDFDPERFVDFYAQKGWMVGKAKMKDWKASVRIWVRSSKPKNGMAKEVPDDGFSAYD
ncbi:hypothetical protein [uncultured Senegalimassilia sp.]|uniref:hypothetical protein n=1 Tax=uncultured Senegalimassilia sp. TaxID=1714350 RepID=UPI0027DB0408|nr:hypothetical protein [uncultured Senegalimassilia sp.]